MQAGPYTQCDLSDARCLLRTENGDYTQKALCMALELAKFSYDMDVSPCLEAGWEDFSFLVDDALLTNLYGQDEKSRKVCMQAAAKARGKLERLDPFSQLLGFRRQREALDTCKAMVMARPMADEKTMIVISFAGTTKRLYEWLGNLRMEAEDGFHAGFLHMTRQFEAKAAEIVFPMTAQRMGFSRLSLMDILQHLRMGNDRFRLFVTGHSQGAALMQIYIYHLMHSGVDKEYLGGIGFASPAVVYTRKADWALQYPIRHFINADDLVARVGGSMHIGLSSVLPASTCYRRACYGEKAWEPALNEMLHILHGVRDTEDALLLGMALMDTLATLDENISEEILRSVARGIVPDVLAQRLKGYARRILQSLNRRLTAKCVVVAGRVNDEKHSAYQAQLQRMFTRFGARESMEMLAEVMMRPHALADRAYPRAYQMLATEYAQALTTSLWVANGSPGWDERFAGERQGRQRRRYSRFYPLRAEQEFRKQTKVLRKMQQEGEKI